MTKPVINTFSSIAPLIIQEYEHYLPTAFDESMTLIQKMNKIIKTLADIGQLSNDLVAQWNTVMEWVMNDGLTEDVNNKLDSMVTDGTLTSLISVEILGDVSKLTTNTKLTIVDAVNEVNSSLAEKAQQSDLETANTNIAKKADKSYVDTQIQSVASGSPKDVYATLTDLQTAFPTGNNNIYLVTADGGWYYWNGSAWTKGGTYQSTGIADGSVTLTKTNFPYLTTFQNLGYQNGGYLSPSYTGTSSGSLCNMSNYVSYPAGNYLVLADFTLTTTTLVNANFIPCLFDGGTVYNAPSGYPTYGSSTDKTHFVSYGIVTLSATKTCRAGINVTGMNTDITNNFSMVVNKIYVIPMSSVNNDVVNSINYYSNVLQYIPVVKLPDTASLQTQVTSLQTTPVTIDKTNFPFVSSITNLAYYDSASYLTSSVSTTAATIMNNLTPYTSLDVGTYLIYMDVNLSITTLSTGRLVPHITTGTGSITTDVNNTSNLTPDISTIKDFSHAVCYGLVTVTTAGNYRIGFTMNNQTTSVTNVYTATVNKVYAVKTSTVDSKVISAIGYYALSKSLAIVTLPDLETAKTDITNIKSLITAKDPILCYGDSMTGATTGWVNTLATTYGVNVLNRGIGGQTAGQIATRQGGLSLIIDPFTIPADTSQVPVTLNQTLYANQSGYEGINPVYINGIKGMLYNSTNTAGGFTFARSTAGTAVTLTRPNVVFTDNMRTYRRNPMIIWVGTNGDYNTSSRTSANLISIIDQMLSYGECKRYLIVGLTTDTNYNIPSINTDLANKYGRRFLDLRSYMIQYGLSDMGWTPTADDTSRIAANNVPSSLLSDGTHFQMSVQQQVTTPLIYKKLQELYMI